MTRYGDRSLHKRLVGQEVDERKSDDVVVKVGDLPEGSGEEDLAVVEP